jgi:integrase
VPILAKVERRAPLMHEKVRQRLYRILDHAVTLGALERNPLPKPEPERRVDRRHFPAVTDLPSIGAILRAARVSDPAKGIQRAHILLVYTAQRISEVVGATWSEFDLQAGTRSIPGTHEEEGRGRGPHESRCPRPAAAEGNGAPMATR